MSEYINPPEWALRFLRERGHAVGQTNGEFIVIDGKSYRIGELPGLADSLHPGEWLQSQNAFLEELLKQEPKFDVHGVHGTHEPKEPSRPKDDAPNAEDLGFGDQGQSGG